MTRQLWLKAGSWTMWRITGPSARERLLAQGVRDLPGWTLRVALDYFVEVYGRAGTGEQYANKWLASRGLDHHPLGVELKRLLTMVDVGLLYDGLDVMNSAAFELIARRCYSIERVLVETGSESDAHVLLELFEAALCKSSRCFPASRGSPPGVGVSANFVADARPGSVPHSGTESSRSTMIGFCWQGNLALRGYVGIARPRACCGGWSVRSSLFSEFGSPGRICTHVCSGKGLRGLWDGVRTEY